MSNNYSGMFDRIEETVQNITSSENIEKLRKNIENTVADVKRTVTAQTAQTARPSQPRQPTQTPPAAPRPPVGNNTKNYSYQYQQQVRYAARPQPRTRAAEPLPPAELAVPAAQAPGHTSGVLLTVFGSIGSAVFGILSLVGLANFFFPSSGAVAFPYVITGLFAASFLAFLTGLKNIRKNSRYKQYLRQFGSSTFCSVKSLAEKVGKSQRYVLRELRRLVKKGMFPHGKFDQQNTCLMIDDKTYEQYLQLQERLRKTQEENAQRQEQYSVNPELKTAVEEGNRVIQEIKDANDAIPGVIISVKLSRLEDVTTKIFRYVEAHPQKLPDIRKFMEYYLPTTLKLVKAYREFDAQPIQGENIQKSKKEIEDTLDTINLAFENMFDDLFLSDAVDISSDISVLETMLHQEGLTGSDFDHKNQSMTGGK